MTARAVDLGAGVGAGAEALTEVAVAVEAAVLVVEAEQGRRVRGAVLAQALVHATSLEAGVARRRVLVPVQLLAHPLASVHGRGLVVSLRTGWTRINSVLEVGYTVNRGRVEDLELERGEFLLFPCTKLLGKHLPALLHERQRAEQIQSLGGKEAAVPELTIPDWRKCELFVDVR